MRILIVLMWVLSLILLSTNSVAKEKPTLTVVSEAWQGFTNEDLTGTYWEIIREVYGDEFQLNLKTMPWNDAVNAVSKKQADIIIGVYQGQHNNILTPTYQIDMDSALYILYDSNLHTINSLDDLANLTIAGREKYVLTNMLPKSTTFYGTESVKDINKLIFNERVDGAIVFPLDVFNADPSGTLSLKQLVPKRKMYLGFADTAKSTQLMASFDSSMVKLLAENKIKPLFSREVYYDFAGFNDKNQSKKISWQLLAKVYDKHLESLKTTQQDNNLTTLLQAELPQYYFDIHLSSVRVVTEEMKNLSTNTCAVSFLKNESRIKDYIFSLPIYTYIKPRLILLNENRKLIPNNSVEDNIIDVEKLLSTSPTFRLASMENSNAYKELKNILSEQQYQQIINIPAGENKNIIALLFNKRVDAIVLWPNEVSDFIDSSFNRSQLMSYEISEQLGNNVNTYIACNNTPTNVEFINSVNSLLQQENFRHSLFANLLLSLDLQSGEAFMKQLTESMLTAPTQ